MTSTIIDLDLANLASSIHYRDNNKRLQSWLPVLGISSCSAACDTSLWATPRAAALPCVDDAESTRLRVEMFRQV